MGEMFKHLPCAAKQRVQHVFAIVLIAAPQDMVMGTGHNLNGVELHKSQLFYQLRRVQGPRRRLRETMRSEPQGAGGVIVNF